MPGRPPLPPLPQRSLYNAPRRAGPGGVGALGSARPGRERQAPIPSAAGAGPSPLHDLYLQRPAVTVARAQLLPALLDGHLLAGLLRTQRGVGSARVGSGRVGSGRVGRSEPAAAYLVVPADDVAEAAGTQALLHLPGTAGLRLQSRRPAHGCATALRLRGAWAVSAGTSGSGGTWYEAALKGPRRGDGRDRFPVSVKPGL